MDVLVMDNVPSRMVTIDVYVLKDGLDLIVQLHWRWTARIILTMIMVSVLFFFFQYSFYILLLLVSHELIKIDLNVFNSIFGFWKIGFSPLRQDNIFMGFFFYFCWIGINLIIMS